MFALYKLITKTKVLSPSIIFPFVSPIIFLLIFTGGNTDAQLTASIFKIISITILQGGAFGFGLAVIELKKSVMLKRIGATKITKAEVFGAAIGFGLTLLAISITWTLAAGFIMSASGYWHSLSGDISSGVNAGDTIHINFGIVDSWGLLLLGMLLSIVLSYTLGVFYISISKNDEAFFGYAMLYFFVTTLICGLFVNQEIREEIDFMVWLGYFNPTIWANQLINSGIDSNTTQWLSLEIIMPIVAIAGILGISVKLFKWD